MSPSASNFVAFPARLQASDAPPPARVVPRSDRSPVRASAQVHALPPSSFRSHSPSFVVDSHHDCRPRALLQPRMSSFQSAPQAAAERLYRCMRTSFFLPHSQTALPIPSRLQASGAPPTPRVVVPKRTASRAPARQAILNLKIHVQVDS